MTDSTPPDVVRLAVRTCMGCYVPDQGLTLSRLLNSSAGIDIFYEQAPVMRFHRCSGFQSILYRNMWKETVLKIPLELYESLKADPVITPGAAVTDLEWRS